MVNISHSNEISIEATHLRERNWVVRPAGRLGTMGWVNGRPWRAVFVKADSAEEAIERGAAYVWEKSDAHSC